jgi:carbamoylphosphate synthase small subunit
MMLFEDLKAFNPDGYFLSNGPGDLSRFWVQFKLQRNIGQQ